MIAQSFWDIHGQAVREATVEHVILVLVALGVASVVAIPAGVLLSRCRNRWLVSAVMGLVNVIQPIPSLALIALTTALFIWLNVVVGGQTLPTVGMGIGLVPLVAYAVLPILRNTYTGIRQVDADLIEVATGMGMRRRQILVRVQLPLALPFIMAGLRIAAVWTIGVGTLVALVGAGGLGDLIFPGLRTVNPPFILAGAIPAALLALLFDWVLGLIERLLTPRGMQLPQAR